MELSPRVRGIPPSTTLALDARARARRAAGRDVINMFVGEPDFEAPAAVQEAACAAVRGGEARYTPMAGTPELRAAIAAHLTRSRGVPFAPEHVVVCHSAKHALSGAVLALVSDGDEVLVPLPAWVSYAEQVRVAGGRPVLVPPRADFGPDLAALRAAVGPRTVGLLLNSPCNPTGHVLSDDDVAALVALAEERDLWILSDEVYHRLVYEGPPARSPVGLGEAARRRTAVVDGASKAFAMTGYRIGFLAGAPELVDAVARLHGQTTGCPNAVSQAAYAAALADEPPEVGRMVAAFAQRRAHLLAGLERLGLRGPPPRGAFYAFPDVSPWLDGRGVEAFCDELLEEHDLALVPGTAFGAPGHVRLSYALGLERLDEALERLATFLAGRRVDSAR